MSSSDRSTDTLPPSRDKRSKGRRLHPALRSIALCIGWIVAGGALGYGVLFLWIDWNLFDFNPKFDTTYAGLVAAILIALAGCAGLALASKDWGSRIVSLLVCLLLIALGANFLPPDHVTHGFLGRSTPTPFWFRSSLAMTLCLPFGLWLRWPLHFWLLSIRERRIPHPPVIT